MKEKGKGMTGFTCKHEDIGLALVPVQYRSEVR
jgi:hypothetical protein